MKMWDSQPRGKPARRKLIGKKQAPNKKNTFFKKKLYLKNKKIEVVILRNINSLLDSLQVFYNLELFLLVYLDSKSPVIFSSPQGLLRTSSSWEIKGNGRFFHDDVIYLCPFLDRLLMLNICRKII